MKHSAAWHRVLPFLVAGLLLVVWHILAWLKVFPPSSFPAPLEVLGELRGQIVAGRLFNDIITSLFRVGAGWLLAVIIGVPLGMWLGLAPAARAALLPIVNFGRSLSPLAWIPFAILWFGIGDKPAIFLIFLACVFPLALQAMSAVANISTVHFRVARDFGLNGRQLYSDMILPAILPQIITALRVTAGLAWLVVVAAEMLAGQDGLGYMIWDARNGLNMDLLGAGMLVIGAIGMIIDRLLQRLTLLPFVRWGYGQ